MKKAIVFIVTFCCFLIMGKAQERELLTAEMAVKLTALPLHCIGEEFPNKTGHIINNGEEVLLSPKDLHPAFYGCLDWHSSVHGHWMLLRTLDLFPNLNNRKEIIAILNNSFAKEKLQAEADYFSKYKLAKSYERTYGWAWLLKLDEELQKSQLPEAKIWRENMKPLTDTIVMNWKKYLPKQTYPNRTGVHPNSAFALGFAMDWARTVGDTEFEKVLKEKAIAFYGTETDTPAYLEPNGSDFFSPSLEIADLMSRIYDEKKFADWFYNFINESGVERVSEIPEVSDLSDYFTVHLVGLSFSRAWCMLNIAKKLPNNSPKKIYLEATARGLLENALPLLFESNYGGDHWLASFALYALYELEK